MRSAPDIATCMAYTGIDPFSKQEVYVARHSRDRKLQRALLQVFKPENYFEVRKALEEAGRADLIGGGCEHTVPNPGREGRGKDKRGSRPDRKTARRRDQR